MPAYKVIDKEADKVFIVEAQRDTSAVQRVAKDRYEVELIRSPIETAKLVGAGATVLTADDDDQDSGEPPSDTES